MENTLLNTHSQQQKPLLVIHTTPAFTSYFNYFNFHNRLSQTYSLLDPTSAAPSTVHAFLRAHAATARALLCVAPSPLGKDIFDCLPSLECVLNTGIGLNHVDLSECRRRGISVANVGDASADDVADLAVGLLLDVLRKLTAADRFVRAGSWPELSKFNLASRLSGKRVGIVGLGSTGTRVARRLLSFGCSIAYNSRQKKSSVSFPYYGNVYDLALASDILILCCSLNDQTHHMINKDVLTALGKEGVIINIGRGPLIDEKELVRFLVDGKIRGAGLDVFENEPHVPKEMLGLENVVLSPHRAITTPESFKAVEDIMVANLEAFFSNKPLISPVRL